MCSVQTAVYKKIKIHKRRVYNLKFLPRVNIHSLYDLFVFFQTLDNKLTTFIDNTMPCVTYKISISAIETEKQYAFYSEVYRTAPRGKEYIYYFFVTK